MCTRVVIDASAFDVFTQISPETAGAQLRLWIGEGHGLVVYSTHGRAGLELEQNAKVRELFRSYRQNGLAMRMESGLVEEEERRLPARRSDAFRREGQADACAGRRLGCAHPRRSRHRLEEGLRGRQAQAEDARSSTPGVPIRPGRVCPQRLSPSAPLLTPPDNTAFVKPRCRRFGPGATSRLTWRACPLDAAPEPPGPSWRTLLGFFRDGSGATSTILPFSTTRTPAPCRWASRCARRTARSIAAGVACMSGSSSLETGSAFFSDFIGCPPLRRTPSRGPAGR